MRRFGWSLRCWVLDCMRERSPGYALWLRDGAPIADVAVVGVPIPGGQLSRASQVNRGE
jgi:hypothetical protein